MLESIGGVELDQDVFRLARTPDEWAFLNELGLDADELAEAQEFFDASPPTDFARLIEEPFQRKTYLTSGWRVGRFSDGTWPVFYAAADSATAVAELTHYRKRAWTEGDYPEDAPYCVWLFSCWLTAHAKDLSGVSTWRSHLIDEDYTFCQELGREASRDSVDALKTPSARAASGINTPTFKRSCLDKLQILRRARFTFDPATQSVSVTLAPFAS